MLEIVKNTVRHRNVLANLVSRDLKVKYRGTIFGYLWSLLEPASLVLIYYFVFVIIARRGGPNYPLFVFLGVLPYTFMSAVVQGGATALSGNAGLIRRVFLPREIFVIAVVSSQLVTFLLSMVAAIPMLLAYRIAPGASILLLPAGVAGLVLFSGGIALIMSCLNVFWRDVAYVLRVVLRTALYVSPVMYSVDMVPERVRDLYLLNPMAVYIELIRGSVMNLPLAVDPPHLVSASLLAILSFTLGSMIFRRLQRKAVKYL